MEYPITVVEVPMGYGKTTVVREAVGRAGITPLWLHAFTGDTDGFCNGFAELIGELDSGCGESLKQLGFPNDAVPMNEALKLISRIKLSTPVVIIIWTVPIMPGMYPTPRACRFVSLPTTTAF